MTPIQKLSQQFLDTSWKTLTNQSASFLNILGSFLHEFESMIRADERAKCEAKIVDGLRTKDPVSSVGHYGQVLARDKNGGPFWRDQTEEEKRIEEEISRRREEE